MTRNFAPCSARLLARTLAVALGVLSLSACDEGSETATTMEAGGAESSTGMPPFDSPACHADSNPTMEIGDGSGTFSPASEVDLVYGPQGGYHIVIGLKLTGFEPTSPIEARLEGRIDGELKGSASVAVGLQCSEQENALIASGLLLVWDSPPQEVGNQDADVLVRIMNGDGQVVENTTTMFVRDNGPGGTGGETE